MSIVRYHALLELYNEAVEDAKEVYTKIHHVIYIAMKHVIVTTMASTITVPRNVVLKMIDIFIPMITRLVTAAIAAAAAVAATKTTIARSCENFSIM